MIQEDELIVRSPPLPSVPKTIVCEAVVGLTKFGRFGHQNAFQNLSRILCLKINDWS